MLRRIWPCILLFAALVAQAQQSSNFARKWPDYKLAGGEDSVFIDHPYYWEDVYDEASSLPDLDWRRLFVLNRLLTSCHNSSIRYGACDSAKLEKYRTEALRLTKTITPQNEDYALELLHLGENYTAVKEHTRALNLFHEGLTLIEKLEGPKSLHAAQAYLSMARDYQAQKDISQSQRTAEFAYGLEPYPAQKPSLDRFRFYRNLAKVLVGNADQPQSIQASNAITRAREELIRLDPKYGEVFSLHFTSLVLVDEDSMDTKLYDELISRLAARTKGVPAAQAQELVRIAKKLQGKREDLAETTWKSALQLAEKYNDQMPPHTLVEIFSQNAKLSEEKSDGQTAIDYYRRAVLAERKQDKPNLTQIAEFLLAITSNQIKMQDIAGAEASFAENLDRARSDASLKLARVAHEFGSHYGKAGHDRLAIPKLEIAVAAYESHRIERAEYLSAMRDLAQAYTRMGRTAEATAINQRIVNETLGGLGSVLSNSPWNRSVRFVGWSAFFALLLILGLPGLLFYLGARSVDRQVQRLFEPKPEPIVWEEVRESFGPPPVIEEPVTEVQLLEEQPLEEPVADTAITAIAESSIPELVFEQLPPPPLPEPPPPPPVHHFAFHGQGLDLFAMRIFHVLLSIFTLGIFSFWGKARVRSYLCSQAEFLSDRFHFHGNGGELFRGWLKGAPFFGFIFFAPQVAQLTSSSVKALLITQFVAFALLLVLWPIARVGAFRYRMNRMSWRGIRFRFLGSNLRYFLTSIFGYLCIPLTLGLYTVKLSTDQRRLLYSQLKIGNREFQFEGKSIDLLFPWFFTIPLTMFSFGLFWPWYSALRSRYFWAQTTLGEARFRCHATGFSLLRLHITNGLLILCTLGLGLSWASLRTVRYWTTRIELIGEIAPEQLEQNESDSSALGESFADFLGFDFGF